MSDDWVVTALVGLGNDPKDAEAVADVFRAIRSKQDPDALQMFMYMIAQMDEQAEAKIAAAEAETEKWRGLATRADAYTDHNWSCTNSYMSVGCTCGVDTLRKEIDALQTSTMDGLRYAARQR